MSSAKSLLRICLSDMPPSANGLRHPSDHELIVAYGAHGSVWKAATALGISGQTVHRRLKKLGCIKGKRLFTDAERNRVAAYYNDTPPASFSLECLATELGRTRQFICRQAKILGLTNPQRDLTSTQLAAVRKPKWQEKSHPRGALGLKHTDATKQKVSAASKLSWVTMKTFSIGNMSTEARQRKSDLASIRMNLQPAEKAYSRARGGRRADLGNVYFRSAWEANYARYLNWLVGKGEIERWEYEPQTFWFLAVKRGVRSYTPDFLVWEKGNSYFVEVKGWMDPKSKTKLKRMKQYYPNIRVDVVGQRQYDGIKSAVSRLVPGWE